MNFIVTKEWKKLPFDMFTTTFPFFAYCHICASHEKPVSKGILYSDCTKSFFGDGSFWIKLDDSFEGEFIEIDVENFI